MSWPWKPLFRRLAAATGWLPRLRRRRRLDRLAAARKQLEAARRENRVGEAVTEALRHHLDDLERACYEGSDD